MTLGDILSGISAVISVPIAYIVFGISFFMVLVLGIWLTFLAGYTALVGLVMLTHWLATLV